MDPETPRFSFPPRGERSEHDQRGPLFIPLAPLSLASPPSPCSTYCLPTHPPKAHCRRLPTTFRAPSPRYRPTHDPPHRSLGSPARSLATSRLSAAGKSTATRASLPRPPRVTLEHNFPFHRLLARFHPLPTPRPCSRCQATRHSRARSGFSISSVSFGFPRLSVDRLAVAIGPPPLLLHFRVAL